MRTDSHTLERRPFLTRKNLLFAGALLLWLFFLWRATHVFTMGSIRVTMFNSDGAIAVLMANENRPTTPYNTYYYGQDRSGAWPYVIAQLIHRATHYIWSNHALFLSQTVWLFVGVLIISLMDRREGLLVGLLFLLPLCLHLRAARNLYEVGQPYAWQITALVFAWWSLRRFCESRCGPAKNSKWRCLVWGLLAFSFSLLAILSSTVSAPALFFLLVLEALRTVHKLNGNQTLKMLGKQFLQVAVPVASATIVELLLRANYHSYSLRHFGNEFRTIIHLDRGHFTENLINQWHGFSNSGWWLLSLLPPIVFALFSARYIYLSRGNKEKLLGHLRKLFLEDKAILVIGTFGIGAINFLITVVISHIRLNNYAERYLTLTYIFISLSGLLTLLLVAAQIKKYHRAALAAIALGSLAFLFYNFPTLEIDPFYTDLQEAAVTLSRKAPGSVLLGSYWETYVFAALDPQNAIIPVPAEGETVRTPWTLESLKTADRVIVEYDEPPLGSSQVTPPAQLVQYGTPLKLVIPRWYVYSNYAFSVYQNEARRP